MNNVLHKKISLNDLPQYSPWPSRILGLSSWSRDARNKDENYREYENEKWGPLVQSVSKNPGECSLEKVSKVSWEDTSSVLCAKGNEFFICDPDIAYSQLAEELAEEFRSKIGSDSLVEMGAGYGNILFRLIRLLNISQSVVAGEFAPSGQYLIREIAKTEGINIRVADCDFNSKPMLACAAPKNAFIYTCASIHYVPDLQMNFIDKLLELRPCFVAHYEPLWQADNTLISLMRNRYLEMNQYNTNLRFLLNDAESAGKIKIIKQRDDLLRINPLMAYTLIIWKPTGVTANTL